MCRQIFMNIFWERINFSKKIHRCFAYRRGMTTVKPTTLTYRDLNYCIAPTFSLVWDGCLHETFGTNYRRNGLKREAQILHFTIEFFLNVSLLIKLDLGMIGFGNRNSEKIVHVSDRKFQEHEHLAKMECLGN